MVRNFFDIDVLTRFVDQSSGLKIKLILLFSGCLSALSFAPFYFFPTYMITLPFLLVVAIRSSNRLNAFFNGYIFGIGHFFAGLYWIGNSFAVEPSLPDWAGFIMVAVLAAYLAVFIGVVTCGIKYFHHKHDLKKHLVSIVLTFVVLWSVGEWLRGILFTGFPWNLSGYIFGFSDIMLQSTAVWGIYGLTIIVLTLTFIPFLTLEKRYQISAPVIGAFIVLFLYLYGANRIPEQLEYNEDVNLRIVQANIKQKDKWPIDNWGKNLITYMDMSEAEQSSGPVHIIWPETAIIYSLSEENLRRQLISKILPPEGGTVFTGFPRRQYDPEGRKVYNSLIAIDENGEIEGIYDKSHLVPFGEYIPSFIRTIILSLGLDKIFTGGQGFSHGPGPSTLNIDGLPPVGVLICYEVIFPGQVVNVKERPDWLLNITNDAWYGDSTGPHQHLLQTRVRSIEEGIPIIRSAGTGISAVIDSYGRVLNKAPLNKKMVINSRLPKEIEDRTFYSMLKEWTFACIIIIYVFANIVVCRRSGA